MYEIVHKLKFMRYLFMKPFGYIRYIDTLDKSGKIVYQGTTYRTGDISRTGHIRETILDISGRDISGMVTGHIGIRHIGEIILDISVIGHIGEVT